MQGDRTDHQTPDPQRCPWLSHSLCNISGARHVCTFNNSYVCVLFLVPFVNTSYLIPQWEQEREEKLFVLSFIVEFVCFFGSATDNF